MATIYCPNCDTEIPESEIICPNCGFNLAEYDETAEENDFNELLDAANKRLNEENESINPSSDTVSQSQINALLNGENIDFSNGSNKGVVNPNNNSKNNEDSVENSSDSKISQSQIDALLKGSIVDFSDNGDLDDVDLDEEDPDAYLNKSETDGIAEGEQQLITEKIENASAPSNENTETNKPQEIQESVQAEEKPAPTPAPAPIENKKAKAPKEKKKKAAKVKKEKSAKEIKTKNKADSENITKKENKSHKSTPPFVITALAAVVAAALGFCVSLLIFGDIFTSPEEAIAIRAANAVNSQLNINERLCVYKAYVKRGNSSDECMIYAITDFNDTVTDSRYRVVVNHDEPSVINIYYPLDETSSSYLAMKNSDDAAMRIQASILKNYSDSIELAHREIMINSPYWKNVDISKINSNINSEQKKNTTASDNNESKDSQEYIS